MRGLAAWFSDWRLGYSRRWIAMYMAYGGMLLLTGCAQPNPLVQSMDDFFDRLDARYRAPDGAGYTGSSVAVRPQHDLENSGIITGPGYAPAYPPYDVRSGQSTSAQ